MKDKALPIITIVVSGISGVACTYFGVSDFISAAYFHGIVEITCGLFCIGIALLTNGIRVIQE